jgi:hypothetical protein
MITIKLDVTKFEKDRFHKGKKGIYADLALIEHPNDFGDDGFVVQSVSKEERDAGERGPIVGNWRELNKKTDKPPERPAKPAPRTSAPRRRHSILKTYHPNCS